MDIITKFISSTKFDLWTLWGLTAQGLFFSRFVVQWYISERHKKLVTPMLFWYLSLTGAIMVIIYALVRFDIVFLITGILQIGLYSRSIVLAKRTQ